MSAPHGPPERAPVHGCAPPAGTPATAMRPAAANAPFRLPPPIWSARCRGCWIVAGLALLVAASFASLDLRLREFASAEALASMRRFVAEFWPPDTSAAFVRKVLPAAFETFAMSAVGTLLAAVFGLALALPAARRPGSHDASRAAAARRRVARFVLNVLRSVPELVWAALLLVSAGLGPLAGTLALAVHTAGVLGRLFAEAIENAAPGPGDALRASGASAAQVLAYAVLPQVLPQIVSYTLYRWENNIRAAAVLGVVGAGGLGQLLVFHLGLFHMPRTATVLVAMLALVGLVDGASHVARRVLNR